MMQHLKHKNPNAHQGNYNFVILHGYTEHNDTEFFPWLKKSLEDLGYMVQVPQMPNTNAPIEKEQVEYVLKNVSFDEKTILIGHSLGCAVALKVLENLPTKITGLGLIAPGGLEKQFWTEDFEFDKRTGERKQYLDGFSYRYDYDGIVEKFKKCIILGANNDASYRLPWMEYLARRLGGELQIEDAKGFHFTASKEPEILKMALGLI